MLGVEATYELHVDWDRDGFFCDGVLPTDPLNLIKNAASWKAIPYLKTTTNSTNLMGEPRPLRAGISFGGGYRQLAVNTGGDALGGVYIGWDGVSAEFPVLASTQYTFSVYLTQSVASAFNKDFSLVAADQSVTALGSASITLSTVNDLIQYSVTFTTGATSTHVFISVQKRTNSDTVDLLVALPMLVLGGTAPSAFNNGHVSNAYDNVSAYVESLNWSFGMMNSKQEISPPAQLVASLYNYDGAFNPESTTSPFIGELSRSVLVRVRATYDSVLYQLALLTMDRLEVEPGDVGERRAILFARDPMLQLLDADFLPDIQENVRTDQVLDDVFERVLLGFPYPSNYWMLGIVGSSELDESTYLYYMVLTDFAEGDTTLEFAGDLTGAGAVISAQAYIRGIVGAELGGRFFFNAQNGTFDFHNRSRDIRDTSSATVIEALEQDEPPQYVWGDDLANDVTVTFYPRKRGVAGSILYSMQNVPVALQAGQERQFTARYQDPLDSRASVAGFNMLKPREGIDYTANEASDGTGGSLTPSILVNVTFHATSAEITLKNEFSGVAYITLFKLVGYPLTAYAQESIRKFDGESIAANGEHRKTIDLPALGNADLAELYANYYLQRYKTPIGRIEQASIWGNRSHDLMESALGLRIGDYVELYDDWLENSVKRYVIVGMMHRVTAKRDHWMRMIVTPLDRTLYWILDDDELSLLGETTRLSL